MEILHSVCRHATPALHSVTSAAWHPSSWEYLSHPSWQMLQVRALSFVWLMVLTWESDRKKGRVSVMGSCYTVNSKKICHIIVELLLPVGCGCMSSIKTNNSILWELLGYMEFTIKHITYFIIIYKLHTIQSWYQQNNKYEYLCIFLLPENCYWNVPGHHWGLGPSSSVLGMKPSVHKRRWRGAQSLPSLAGHAAWAGAGFLLSNVSWL